ncbi:MAG: RHS repeat-associated core domain-containing protein [Ignavibacteria bacterium]|nr:RHS repeat-associated core domain-containing protein [Ignavibacteria bacterium]
MRRIAYCLSENVLISALCVGLYWYDEAGNRIRKEKYQWILTGGSPDLEDPGQAEPVGEEESGSWVFVEATNYIRDIAGREIAIYSSNTLQQWNMYGLDNVGNIKANGDKLYYLKDHLGTVRAVLDTTNAVVAAYDYDPWGYPLSNRTYEASSTIDQKYKFTSKQRDKESGVNGKNGYDYFGARYYDSRIGRWGGVDPSAKYKPYLSPFAYSSDNPISRIDPDGRWDIDVHVFKDRSQYGYGVAIVKDRKGNEVYRFTVRVEGVGGRNRMVKNSDTPLGKYDIPDKNMWLTGSSREAYGPNARLVLTGVSGEIKESDRDLIRIHGGRQEVYDKKTGNWKPVENPVLEKTHGCIRTYDEEVKTLKTVTDDLMQNDAEEYGGELNVIDDLVEVDGSYEVPTDAKKAKHND